MTTKDYEFRDMLTQAITDALNKTTIKVKTIETRQFTPNEQLEIIRKVMADWENGRFVDAVACYRIRAILNGDTDGSIWLEEQTGENT